MSNSSKSGLYIFIVVVAVIVIYYPFAHRPVNWQQSMDEIRQHASRISDSTNAVTLKWENLLDGFYKTSDMGPSLALTEITYLINNDTTYTFDDIAELHFVKGDIYYNIDSFEKARDEFTIALRVYETAPKYLAARAGAFIKLKQYDNAFNDLVIASRNNYYYDWNLGNYYEIINKKDSAIYFYHQLYLNDTTTYKYCKERIAEFQTPHSKPLTGLVYKDRDRKVLLMEGVK